MYCIHTRFYSSPMEFGWKAGINWSTINYPWSKLGDHADYLSGFQVELSQLTNSTTTSIYKPNYSTLPEDIRTMNFTLPMKAELSSAIPTHAEPTI